MSKRQVGRILVIFVVYLLDVQHLFGKPSEFYPRNIILLKICLINSLQSPLEKGIWYPEKWKYKIYTIGHDCMVCFSVFILVWFYTIHYWIQWKDHQPFLLFITSMAYSFSFSSLFPWKFFGEVAHHLHSVIYSKSISW